MNCSGLSEVCHGFFFAVVFGFLTARLAPLGPADTAFFFFVFFVVVLVCFFLSVGSSAPSEKKKKKKPNKSNKRRKERKVEPKQQHTEIMGYGTGGTRLWQRYAWIHCLKRRRRRRQGKEEVRTECECE